MRILRFFGQVKDCCSVHHWYEILLRVLEDEAVVVDDIPVPGMCTCMYTVTDLESLQCSLKLEFELHAGNMLKLSE